MATVGVSGLYTHHIVVIRYNRLQWCPFINKSMQINGTQSILRPQLGIFSKHGCTHHPLNPFTGIYVA